MRNEVEKKTVAEVASRLLKLSADLLDDKFISAHDLAGTLNRLANRLMDSNAEKQSGREAESAAEPRKIWRYCDMKSMPRGIEMKEFVHADGSLTFVGQYYRHGAPEGAKPKRVYRVEVRKTILPDEFSTAVFEDDVRLVRLSGGTSKWNLVYAALGALRGILHKRCAHTSTNRKAKRKAKEGK